MTTSTHGQGIDLDEGLRSPEAVKPIQVRETEEEQDDQRKADDGRGNGRPENTTCSNIACILRFLVALSAFSFSNMPPHDTHLRDVARSFKADQNAGRDEEA